MKKAIIFDMDGVIIDSEHLWSEAIRDMLERKGFEYDENAKVRFMGGGLDPELRHYKEIFNLKETVDELKNDLINIALEVFEQKLEPKDGVIDLLKKLSDHNYRLALATSSPERVMKYVLENFEIEKLFKVKVTDDEVDLPKPAPDIYLLAVKKLNSMPGDCVAIEDSINGVKSAQAAGLKVIGLENKIVKKKDFGNIDLVVKSLSELKLSDFK